MVSGDDAGCCTVSQQRGREGEGGLRVLEQGLLAVVLSLIFRKLDLGFVEKRIKN